ncbi:uncharacterized protein A4U43_C02F19260 [Asparagus officinalis]|uniref:UDP-glycosyltransferases domain-containing protein n=1 Tax=Asparagus officinalis TaxID=4686 RepID=A0A5P1FJD8_ASPOF|nr:uncharacterized protein A4U43_C02F19260 [Asparagus officinalis]
MPTPADLLHVAAIPYPGRGNINAMLSLCRRLLLLVRETVEPLCKYIPGHNSLRLSDLSFLLNSKRRQKQALEVFSMVRKANCILFTSFYELGAQVIDTLREQLHCPVYTIGPSIPYMHLEDTNNNIDHIEEWLDSQPKESVLYISLGSFLSVSGAQMDEIAVGLKLSGARFVWVVRGDFSSRLREMAGEMGIIVPWDQFVDSRLIVDDWKIGLNLRGNIKSECVVGREEISSAVKKLMDLDCDEGGEMRRRAAELRASARRAVSAAGSSTENLNSIVRALMLGDGR